jgi:hypothetical protein
MREISPALNASAEEFLRSAPRSAQELVARIRKQKEEGKRPRPSTHFIDHSLLLNGSLRPKILDKVASLVDENLFGRAEMCMQFAGLLQQALVHLHLPARSIVGTCLYFEGDHEIFRWQHAWVRVGKEVIDGNVDSLFENPLVPSSVKVAPYWGPIDQTPRDRRLRENHGEKIPADEDVSKVWWPELCSWLDQNITEWNNLAT